MPITGWLCESTWGWRSAYYLFGLLSLILFLLFFVLYRNNPSQSPFISRKEASDLATANEQSERPEKAERVPYLRMLSDSAVWACISSGIGSGLAYWMFAQYGPTYMNKVWRIEYIVGIFNFFPFLAVIYLVEI
jgi:MFS transporter, ACS family, solute carrier family 17 (sodium-dependent inorganic phosphate cotransporter), member 5